MSVRIARLRTLVAWGAATATVTGLMTAAPVYSVASHPAEPAASALIVGTWSVEGGVVEVTADRSDNYSSFIGRITKAYTTACPIAVGEVVWRIRDDPFGTPPTAWGMATYDAPGAQGPECGSKSDSVRFLMPTNDVLQIRGRDAIEGPYSDIYEAHRLSGGPAPNGGTSDTSPPTIEAIGSSRPLPIGSRPSLQYRVSDDSGKARVRVALYSDGLVVATGDTGSLRNATGQLQAAQLKKNPTASGNVGPFYFCVWAEDAAGNRSAGWPQSSCAWRPIAVSLGNKNVANGCGSGGATGEIQHLILNNRRWGKYRVSFAKACNVHDAGYGGMAIEDPFTGKLVDFRDQTRLQVDDRFLRDLQTLCHTYPKMQGAPAAILETCLTSAKTGAVAYYNGVRQFATAAFDSDVTKPNPGGVAQTEIPVSTNPAGGGRSNA